jgi:hypothetical protein
LDELRSLQYCECEHSFLSKIAMARNLHEVVAAVQAERRAKIAAAYRQKLIAKKKRRQLEEAKRVMELDRNLIVIAVLIVALPSGRPQRGRQTSRPRRR